MAGISIMFNPVMMQVIEANIEINNELPPMANFGERALAMVKEINATVVIMAREPVSWLVNTGSGGSSASPCPLDDSCSSAMAPEICVLKVTMISRMNTINAVMAKCRGMVKIAKGAAETARRSDSKGGIGIIVPANI